MKPAGVRPRELGRVFLAFTALAFVFWPPVVVSRQALFYDTLFRLFYPNAEFFKASVRAGSFPYWNPHLFGGAPFLANLQSALFYPFTWFYVPFGYAEALSLNVALHAALAALFMFMLGRDLGLTKPSSALAAVVFAFNGWTVMHYAYPSNTNACVWLPIVLLYIRKAGRGEGGVPAAAAAVALLLFAGHPQFFLYAAAALALQAACAEDRKRALSVTAVAVGAGLLAAAVQLLPAARLILDSPRNAGLGYEWASSGSVGPGELSVMLLGPLWNRWFTPLGGDPHILGFYIGLPALALAVAGARSKAARPWTLTALLGVLLALGGHLPGYRFLCAHVFPFGSIRFPAQALYLSAFGAAVLAGFGLDKLREERGFERWAVAALCLLDLWVFSLKAVETIPPAVYENQTPAIGWLRSRAGSGRLLLAPRSRHETASSGRTRLEAWLRFKDTLFPNIAMAYGLDDAEGREELRSARTATILEELAADPLSPWMDILGIRWVLSYWELPPKFRPVARFTAGLYENPAAFPRAYFATAAAAVDDADVSAYIRKKRSADLLRTVVLPAVTPGEEGKPTKDKTDVVARDDGPNRVLLYLNAPERGWVVLTDAWDAGWNAHVNGRNAEVLRANGNQRAVAVSAGGLKIEFEYRPPAFGFAAFLTLASLAGLAGWALKEWADRRRASAA